MLGKIIRGVGGFYYVHAEDGFIYECRAKGIFRKENIKPLVGDNARISVIDSKERTGNVDALLPRKNEVIRPASANVDQAMVIFSVASPKPNLNLLDRFLILMQRQEIPVIICFNKTDLASGTLLDQLSDIYKNSGCQVCFASAVKGCGLQEIRTALEGKTTILAGPSGVGKSSLTNALAPEKEMEVGELSRKTERGKNTTRHTELIVLSKRGDDGRTSPDTYIMDTPGFSSLYLENIEYNELKEYFPEFLPYEQCCRFVTCMHLKEPDCAVKKAVDESKISRERYESYVLLTEDLKNRKKY